MFNQKMQELGQAPSAIRELFAYGLQRKAEIGDDKVFDFSIGNPSVSAPASVGRAIVELGQMPAQDVHAYTPSAGDAGARKAIADSLNRRFCESYAAENVFITCGATGSLNVCMKALIEPDDEFIVVSPFFPEYRVWIQNHGAKCVEVPARESDFQIDLPAVKAAINNHTKAVIINSPNNPVGVVYSRENLEGLADVLRDASAKNGSPLFLMSDEPYRELVFDGLEVPWVPDIYENTLVCYSWSKSLSLPGERIGYVLVPPTVADWRNIFFAICGAARVLGHICAPALFQKVIERCVDEPADVEAYARNRKLLTDIMDELGYTYIQPQGAFYLWLKALEPDEKAFSARAKSHELLLVPSESFGVKGWVRIGYCVSEQVITGSKDAFAALRAEYE